MVSQADMGADGGAAEDLTTKVSGPSGGIDSLPSC